MGKVVKYNQSNRIRKRTAECNIKISTVKYCSSVQKGYTITFYNGIWEKFLNKSLDEGYIVYETTENKIYFYNSTKTNGYKLQLGTKERNRVKVMCPWDGENDICTTGILEYDKNKKAWFVNF